VDGSSRNLGNVKKPLIGYSEKKPERDCDELVLLVSSFLTGKQSCILCFEKRLRSAQRPPNKRLHPTAYRSVYQRLCAHIGTCRWDRSCTGSAAGETRRWAAKSQNCNQPQNELEILISYRLK
jgi:hypothetical protein